MSEIAVTYFQRSTAASNVGTPPSPVLASREASTTAGGASSDIATGNIAGGGTGATNVYFFTDDPAPGTDGATGDYSVVLRFSTGNAQILASVALARVNSSGAQQATTALSAEQASNAGPLTFGFTAENLGTWAAGDRLRVRVQLRNQHSMNQSCTLAVDTSDDAIATPFAGAPEPPAESTASIPLTLDVGGTVEAPSPPPAGFVVATRTSQVTTDGTSHVVTLPDGSNVSGRRVVVVFARKLTTGTVSWPAGWTEVVAGNGTDTNLNVGYRDIDGTEGFDGTDDTITLTTSASVRSNHHSYLISSGHDPTTAPQAAATVNGSDSGTADPPNLTPAWGAEENLWIAAAATRWNATFTAAPTDYTDLLALGGGAGDSPPPLGTARRVLNASSENPGTFAHNGGSVAWVATTVAVRPGAGAVLPAEVTASIPLELGVAATAATSHAAQATIPLTLDVAPVTDAPGVGPAEVTATIPLTLDVAATAQAQHQASAAIALELDLAPATDAPGVGTAEVTANIPLTIGVAGATATEHHAAAIIPLELDVAPSTRGDYSATAAIPLTVAIGAVAQAEEPLPPPFIGITVGPMRDPLTVAAMRDPLAAAEIDPAQPVTVGELRDTTPTIGALRDTAPAIGELRDLLAVDEMRDPISVDELRE